MARRGPAGPWREGNAWPGPGMAWLGTARLGEARAPMAQMFPNRHHIRYVLSHSSSLSFGSRLGNACLGPGQGPRGGRGGGAVRHDGL